MWTDVIAITGIWVIVVYVYLTFRTVERIETNLQGIRTLLSHDTPDIEDEE